MKWYDAPIVVLDVETTGFRKPSYIIEMGAVRYEKGLEVARLDVRFRPPRCVGRAIEPGASAVHGIVDEDLVSEPTFAERYGELREFLRGAAPASYGDYDPRMVSMELGRLYEAGTDVDERIPAFSRSWGPWLDLLAWARQLHPGPRRKGKHKLGTMTAKYGVELTNAHNALADAAATGELLWVWRDRLPDVSLAELLAQDLPG
jgi:DNA polymerase-3 subunit epsilon